MAMNTISAFRTSSEASGAGFPSGVTMPYATRVWYNKVFLSVAEPELVHDRYGMKTTLPKNTGEQVMWRRWNKLATATVPLTEGVTPSGSRLTYEHVLATAKWYGDFVMITDVVDFTHVDNVLSIATERLAMQAAETKDEITRDIINAGTGFIRVTADGDTPAHSDSGARSTVNGVITKAALDSAITILESADAKYYMEKMNASVKVATQPIGPAYIAIIHPHVAHSMVQTASGLGDDWVPREKYAAGTVAYPTEIGKYRNVRFVTSTAAMVWADEGGSDNVNSSNTVGDYRSTSGSAADVYSCLIIAKEAYGTVNLKGASATYYDPPGGNSDPMHQRSTAGWKGCWTAAILNDSYIHRIECAALW